METQTVSQKNSYLGLVGWMLFILGNVLLLMNSLMYLFLYGPVFLASFIIAIILISQRKTGSGVSLLLLTLIIPPSLWVGMLANNFSDAMQTSKQANRMELVAKKKAIKFEEVRLYSEGNYMYCVGKVRNTGSSSYDFVKVKIEWLDRNNNILDTDWTYAVGGEGLDPSAAKSFKIMTEIDDRMERGNYYIIE
jgi:hypothetical protein